MTGPSALEAGSNDLSEAHGRDQCPELAGDTRYSQCSYRNNGQPTSRVTWAAKPTDFEAVSGASAQEVCEESVSRDLAFLVPDFSQLASPLAARLTDAS